MSGARGWAWSKLRARHAEELAYAGQVECWRPECDRIIRPGDQWDLGHRLDHALGGGDQPWNLGIECRGHNRSLGAAEGNRNRRRPRPLPNIAP